MPRSKGRRKHGRRPSTSAARARRARRTQAAQRVPVERKESEKRGSRPAARLLLGWGCVATAALLFTSHLVQHAGFINLLPEPAADLLMGYPSALGLAIAGVIILAR